MRAAALNPPSGSSGFQTCRIADFQIGRPGVHPTAHVRKPATQQTRSSALPVAFLFLGSLIKMRLPAALQLSHLPFFQTLEEGDLFLAPRCTTVFSFFRGTTRKKE
jgi:hypothetical protein